MGLISRGAVALASLLGAAGGFTVWGAVLQPGLLQWGLMPAAPLWLIAGLAPLLGATVAGLGTAVRLQAFRHETAAARRCQSMGMSMTERPGQGNG